MLLGAPGIATRSILTTSNKKLSRLLGFALQDAAFLSIDSLATEVWPVKG